jgi:hypothetical protein
MHIQYVVARYNEPIDWLRSDAHDVIIYNKGDAIEFKNVVQLPNVGREAHAYLYHVIENYDSLADITMFTQARVSDHGHDQNLDNLTTRFVDNTPQFRFSSRYETYVLGQSRCIDPMFNIYERDNLIKSHAIAEHLVDKITFGEWFEKNIMPTYPQILNLFSHAIFAVSRTQILSRPKEYYERLIVQLSTENAPIEAHFLERSWFYVFNCHI